MEEETEIKKKGSRIEEGLEIEEGDGGIGRDGG